MNKHTFRKKIERGPIANGVRSACGSLVVRLLLLFRQWSTPMATVSVLYAMNRCHFLQIDTLLVSRRANRVELSILFRFFLFFYLVFKLTSCCLWLNNNASGHCSFSIARALTVVSQRQDGWTSHNNMCRCRWYRVRKKRRRGFAACKNQSFVLCFIAGHWLALSVWWLKMEIRKPISLATETICAKHFDFRIHYHIVTRQTRTIQFSHRLLAYAQKRSTYENSHVSFFSPRAATTKTNNAIYRPFELSQ